MLPVQSNCARLFRCRFGKTVSQVVVRACFVWGMAVDKIDLSR
jgi:hypothetical protein